MNHLPGEIYQGIFIYLSPPDLLRTGATSRVFHLETNRILYRHVDLSNAFVEQLLSWAKAVTHNASLSQLVRTFRCPSQLVERRGGAIYFEDSGGVVKDALTGAFGAIVNLSSLEITPSYVKDATLQYEASIAF